MADKVTVWYDAEADYLEVQFREGSGTMRETAHDAVMERADAQGNILGFAVLDVSQLTKARPLEATLTAA